jgi:hypothetical protein
MKVRANHLLLSGRRESRFLLPAGGLSLGHANIGKCRNRSLRATGFPPRSAAPVLVHLEQHLARPNLGAQSYLGGVRASRSHTYSPSNDA